jgi:hypothetical protein
MTVIPMILSRPPQSRQCSIQEPILKQVQDLNLIPRSLSVVAVLSCLYENKNCSVFLAARGILNPSSKYTRKDAHNALSDLRALEIFISGLGIERPGFALCTCDLPLAALWAGLNASEQRWKNQDRFTFTMSLIRIFFPGWEVMNVRSLPRNFEDNWWLEPKPNMKNRLRFRKD